MTRSPGLTWSRLTEDDGRVVIALVGDMDLPAVGELRRAMDVGLAGSAQLVVDFTDVAFMDSAGLGVLISAHKRLTEAGRGPLVLRSVAPKIFKVLDITGMTKVFQITRQGS